MDIYLNRLGDLAVENGSEIFAFVLIPNHFQIEGNGNREKEVSAICRELCKCYPVTGSQIP